MTVPGPVARWAALPGPSALLAAVRLRARRGQQTESGVLRAFATSPGQRREIAQLLGTQWELSGRPVRLQDLATRLAEHGLRVRDLVESVAGGPIEADRAVRDRAAAAAASETVAAAATLCGCGVDPAHVESWLTGPGLPRAGTGELARLADQVALVWRRLPAGSPVRLAQLAADTTHDAHALDADQVLGRAAARLAAAVHGLPRPQRAGQRWRDAWAAAGVRCDAVSSRVLVLNLPLCGDSPAARLCAAAGAAGEPLWLTLRSLAGPWTVGHRTADLQAGPADHANPAGHAGPAGHPDLAGLAGRVVFVCENATVVEAAADALGPRCPPLVCTDGIASGAALDLLAGLAAAGAAIHVRADVDPAGFTIVEQVRSVAPTARPWRFDAPTYAAALGLPTAAPPADTDAALQQLRDAYASHAKPLHEERLLDQLIADLRATADPPAHRSQK